MQQDHHPATDDHRKFAVTDELILVGEGSKCPLCGQINYFHRAGCKCWDLSRMQDEEYVKTLMMEYGQLTQGNEFGGFVSYTEIHEHIKAGGKAFFWDGTEITEAMFAKNSKEAEPSKDLPIVPQPKDERRGESRDTAICLAIGLLLLIASLLGAISVMNDMEETLTQPMPHLQGDG